MRVLFLISFVLVIFCFISSFSFLIGVLLELTVLLSIVFFIRDSLLLILISFELSTLPILFIIFIYGSQPEISSACYYLVVYSLVGGLPFLVGVGMVRSLEEGWILFFNKRIILFLLPFVVKLPSYFFHLWLPQAHVEAPTEGSIVLASIILKLGSFGLFRLRILSSSFLFVLRVVGVLVRPLVALVQRDLKSLVAYRRVAHMAILRFSLWCVSLRSFFARWVIQVRHGFVSALLFYLVGGIFHKRGSRLLYFRKDSNFYLFFVCCVFNSGGPISLSFWEKFPFLWLF